MYGTDLSVCKGTRPSGLRELLCEKKPFLVDGTIFLEGGGEGGICGT